MDPPLLSTSDDWSLSTTCPTAWASLGGEIGPYLLQVVKLHCDLPEEEIDVAAPLHRVDKVWLCRRERSKPSCDGRKAFFGAGNTVAWVTAFTVKWVGEHQLITQAK